MLDDGKGESTSCYFFAIGPHGYSAMAFDGRSMEDLVVLLQMRVRLPEYKRGEQGKVVGQGSCLENTDLSDAIISPDAFAPAHHGHAHGASVGDHDCGSLTFETLAVDGDVKFKDLLFEHDFNRVCDIGEASVFSFELMISPDGDPGVGADRDVAEEGAAFDVEDIHRCNEGTCERKFGGCFCVFRNPMLFGEDVGRAARNAGKDFVVLPSIIGHGCKGAIASGSDVDLSIDFQGSPHQFLFQVDLFR